ncbi:MAG: Acyl-CoA N-acyltransferase [Chlamydiia bacterium]|nr:Acyl-CoA N-acyltransferase [Chlamydiia bacterium]
MEDSLENVSIVHLEPVLSEQTCRVISSTLPEWFGIPEANEKYAAGVKERTSFSAVVQGECAGMITLDFPFPNVANIYWLAVKKEFHHQGIGTALLKYAESFCLMQKYHSLTVETLSPKQNDSNYLKTYNFYKNLGFQELFELQPYGPDNTMIYLFKKIGFDKS